MTSREKKNTHRAALPFQHLAQLSADFGVRLCEMEHLNHLLIVIDKPTLQYDDSNIWIKNYCDRMIDTQECV